MRWILKLMTAFTWLLSDEQRLKKKHRNGSIHDVDLYLALKNRKKD